jgi:hypothetical protein
MIGSLCILVPKSIKLKIFSGFPYSAVGQSQIKISYCSQNKILISILKPQKYRILCASEVTYTSPFPLFKMANS